MYKVLPVKPPPDLRPEGSEPFDFLPEGPESLPEGPDLQPEEPETFDFRPEGPKILPE